MQIFMIPIDKLMINWERRVRNTDPEQVSLIKTSISEEGLIRPLVVMKKDDHFVVIGGVYRLLALRELGFETVPCYLYG